MGQSSSRNNQNEQTNNSSIKLVPPTSIQPIRIRENRRTTTSPITYTHLSYAKTSSNFIQLYRHTIPNDVFNQILLFIICDVVEIVPLYSVNKNWRDMCDTEYVWKQLAHRFNQSSSQLSVSNYLSQSVFIPEIQSWKDLVVYNWLLHKYSKIFFAKQEKEYSRLLRIVICGSDKSGKTTLFNLLLNGELLQLYKPTIGVEYYKMHINSFDVPFILNVFECCGQEKFATISYSVANRSHLYILMYDLDKPVETFNNAQQLLRNSRLECGTTVCIIGNKSDLKWNSDVSKQAEKLCSENGYYYYECSVKTKPLEAYMMFQDICELVYQSQQESIRPSVCH
jgi:small GTP-binding protein